MKKTLRLFFALCVMLLVGTACDDSEYVNLIPADATFVASVDMRRMAEKGELKDSRITSLINGYMGLVVSGGDRQKMTEIMEDPGKTGLDFTAPVYLFKTRSECIGITMKVNNEGRFEDFIKLLSGQGLCGNPVERDGLKWNSLLEDIDFAYNENSVLFLVSLDNEGGAMSKVEINALYALDKDRAFVGTEHYSRMSDQGKDVVVYSNMSAMSSDVAGKIMSFFPSGIRSTDIEVIATLDFSVARAVLSAELYSENEKVQQMMKEGGDNLRKIEGRYADSPSKDFCAWACCNVNGEWLLNFLKRDKEIRQMLFLLERGIDIEMMIKAIDGDVAISFPNTFVTSDTDNVDFIATANVTNTDFLNDVDYWRKSMKDYGVTLESAGKNTFMLKTGDYELQWGVEDDNLFFTTPAACRQNAFSPRSEVLKPHIGEINNSLLYVYVNLESLPLREIAMVTGMNGMAGDRLSAFESVVFRIEDTDKIELVLSLKDKEKNFLKTLFY